MSATELMARRAKDQEYQRKKDAFDAELTERVAVLRAAEQPVVHDLGEAGVEVESGGTS